MTRLLGLVMIGILIFAPANATAKDSIGALIFDTGPKNLKKEEHPKQ